METPEKKDVGGEDKGGCCSKAKCCGCKALAAIALLAIGAVGGYFGGRCCGLKDHAKPAVEAPVVPAK